MNAIVGLFNSKSYELPIARDYVRHWGMAEAVREIIQNAIDSDSPFEYEITGDTLVVRSRFAKLAVGTLLLGATSKAEVKGKIGSFGEGYKIALLVLTREGYKVVVRNGDRLWTPGFVHSRQFDAEVLCIEDVSAPRKVEGIEFEVSGLSPSDIEQVRASCLFMQSHIGALISTSYGNILMEQPGKLYVGGLFVCKTEMHYGYDIKPEHLRLERDRQTVSTFDLTDITCQMWYETERFEQIATMIDEGYADLRYAEFSAPEMVKEACYRHFQKQHPGAVIAKDKKELDRLIDAGMTRVIVHERLAPIVSTSHSYMANVPVRIDSPTEVLESFMRENRSEMRTKAIVAFKSLMERSKGWTVK
jgi:hypothetical protein